MSLIRDIHTDLDALAERHQQLAGQRAVKKLRGKRVAEHTLAFLGSPAGLLVSAAGGVLVQRWLNPAQASADESDEVSDSAAGDESGSASTIRQLLKTVVTRMALQRAQQALAAFQAGQADAEAPTEADLPEPNVAETSI